MKNIILAFDSTNFSESTFEFIRRLNEKEKVMVTGVFMPLVNYANLWSYATVTDREHELIPLVEAFEIELVEENIKKFRALCQENKIGYKVHKDFSDFALPELNKESRFADLIIINGETFLNNTDGDHLAILREAIHEIECPILILPEKFVFPDNNILAYDGTEMSVFAIKQFAYLFPELTNNPTLLIYVDEENDIPFEDQIIELTTLHFDEISFNRLAVNARKYFYDWLKDKHDTILISGSFNRSSFSQLFRKSFVTDVIKHHKIPVFIAHK